MNLTKGGCQHGLLSTAPPSPSSGPLGMVVGGMEGTNPGDKQASVLVLTT